MFPKFLVAVVHSWLAGGFFGLDDVRAMKNDDYVTTTYVSKALGVSRQTVSRWVRESKLVATTITVGSRPTYRIRYSDYRAFLERYVRGEVD